jgi:hypothetical protein
MVGSMCCCRYPLMFREWGAGGVTMRSQRAQAEAARRAERQAADVQARVAQQVQAQEVKRCR